MKLIALTLSLLLFSGFATAGSQADYRVYSLISNDYPTTLNLVKAWAADVALSEGPELGGHHTVNLSSSCETVDSKSCSVTIQSNEISSALGFLAYETVMIRFYEVEGSNQVSAVEVLPGLSLHDEAPMNERALECIQSGRTLSTCFSLTAWFSKDGFTITFRDVEFEDASLNLLMTYRQEAKGSAWSVKTQYLGFTPQVGLLVDTDYNSSLVREIQ